MEKFQKISLVAVAIALFSSGLLVVNNSNLQSDLRNLNINLNEQNEKVVSLNSDLKASQAFIQGQNEHITQLDHTISIQNESISQLDHITSIQDENIAQLQDKIRSIDNRTTLLEQKLNNQVNNPEPSKSLGVIGWWSGDGHATDSTGNHPGTLSNSATFTSGKTGLAFSLNGVDGYISLGTLGINNENNAFSITTWINPDVTTFKDSLSHRIVAEGANTTGFGNNQFFTNLSLTNFNGPGTIEFQIGATQMWYQEKITTPVITPGKWTFVAVTYDGSKTSNGIKIYADGIEQTTVSSESGFTGTSVPRDEWMIGADSSGSHHSYFFGGGIDETKIFDCALTTVEIQEEFQGHGISKC